MATRTLRRDDFTSVPSIPVKGPALIVIVSLPVLFGSGRLTNSLRRLFTFLLVMNLGALVH
jgi:hypothetical protein